MTEIESKLESYNFLRDNTEFPSLFNWIRSLPSENLSPSLNDAY